VLRPPIARGKHEGKLSEPNHQVDDPESGNAAADEVVRDDRPDGRQGGGKVVVVPELGPRQDDEQETNLEKKGDPGQAANQMRILLPAIAR
jgi:hypothetical protein